MNCPKVLTGLIYKKSPDLGASKNSLPLSNWAHVYIDGSLEETVRKGGAGIWKILKGSLN